jgi:hypothetical protein
VNGWGRVDSNLPYILYKDLFGHVRIMSYLCKMKTYLNTPTSELTTHQIRRVVCETIKWCETNLGTKSYKVNYSVRTLGDKYVPAYGRYDSTIRTIMVYRNYSPTVKSVVRAVLHEYTHYLQNLRWYNNVLSKVGYNKHPQEIEARGMENMYSECWNNIKNKI